MVCVRARVLVRAATPAPGEGPEQTAGAPKLSRSAGRSPWPDDGRRATWAGRGRARGCPRTLGVMAGALAQREALGVDARALHVVALVAGCRPTGDDGYSRVEVGSGRGER